MPWNEAKTKLFRDFWKMFTEYGNDVAGIKRKLKSRWIIRSNLNLI